MAAWRAAWAARASAARAAPRPQLAHRQAGGQQVVDGAQVVRQEGALQALEPLGRPFQLAHQQQAPHLQVLRVGRVAPVAVRCQRALRGPQRGAGPGQVARGQRDLAFGQRAARPGHGIARPEGARGAAHQRARPVEIAQLRQRDAAQGQRRRVVAQGHLVQRRQRIAQGQRARRGGDTLVHGHPITIQIYLTDT